MIDGDPKRLDRNDQASLAQWLYKTALMVATQMAEASTNPESSTLPRTHYADLESSLDLPPSSMVWIGRVEHPPHRRTQRIQRFMWQDRALTGAAQAEGYSVLLTFMDIVGLVAVLDTRQSPGSAGNPPPFSLGDPAAGKLLRLWPSSPHYSVAWPPPLSFTASEIDLVATVFERVAAGRASR